jgi:uncharacterized Zn-binding protein involved in type VI secretion
MSSIPVARGATVDSVTTNHDCSATTTTEGLSGNVLVNGTGVHRQGDLNTAHTVNAPQCPAHQTAISAGSGTVFANGMGVARITDQYDGGEVISSGSGNVFSG